MNAIRADILSTKVPPAAIAGKPARTIDLRPAGAYRRSALSPHVTDLRPQTTASVGTPSSREQPTFYETLSHMAPAKVKVPTIRADLVKQIAKALIVVIAAVIFLSLNTDLPERFIGIYFVASLVYAIDSQRTFLTALVFLVLVAIWSAIGSDDSAQNYAVYAFYFLIIGIISALRETLWPKIPSPKPDINRSVPDGKHLQFSPKI